MTLIGAKRIKDKWAIFADDGVTVGQKTISATAQYRPKIREVNGENIHLIIASCGDTKDIDYFINKIEDRLDLFGEIYDLEHLQGFLQDALYDCTKDLKELKESVECSMLILETNSNTLWATEEYSLFRVNGNVELAFGSAEQAFHSIDAISFYVKFWDAVKSDEFCKLPIWVYYNNDIAPLADYRFVNPEENILQLTNLPDDNSTPREDRNYGMTYGFTGGEAEKFGQDTGNADSEDK